tara:strand:+ start:683 stop:1522 length:840 start_codon:yes stop_codon:yes gene_type:complete
VTIAVLNWAIDKLSAGERVAIASVIEAQGSVPGKPGARLVISSSGSRFGTIGGAGLELKVEQALEEMLDSGGDYHRKSGGRVEVFLLHKDGKGKEVTALDSLCGGRVTVAMEVIEPMPHVLIAGGGHVGVSLAIICDTLGWSHSVFDVRKEFSNKERFPFAREHISSTVSDFLDSEDEESISRFSDILLLGHDWGVDEELLIGALKIRGKREGPRIGAIGSKSKWSSFRKSAIHSGVKDGWVDSVRCPIGLDIGADSPEEIAIAVCAEILSLERRDKHS